MKSPIYKNSIRDKRVRDYVSAFGVVWSQKFDNPEFFCRNREIQPLFSGEFDYVETVAGSSIILDFGIELHGGIRIINGGAKGRIRLRFGESVSEAMGQPNQDHSIHDTELDIPSAGFLEYGATAFRYVRIDILAGDMKLINILAVALYYDTDWVGNFKSSDELLDRVWHTGAYTVLLNMQDYIYDGPKRDRIVWMGDMHPEIRCILSVFSDTTLICDSLDFLTNHYPLPWAMNRIPSYSFWYIISLADYYERTGNFDFILKHKENICNYMKVFESYILPDGSENTPERRFLDWPSISDPNALHAGLQGLLYWTFCKAEYLLTVLGLPLEDVRNAQQCLRSHIPDPGHNKAAASILTVSGLDDRSDVVEAEPYNNISTFYGYYMLQSKSTMSALELIRRYWGGMLKYGATTFWEDFDLKWTENSTAINELPVPGKNDIHADFGDHCYKGLRRSLCHGWACGPTPFLSERISGIKFLKPGGKEVCIAPDLGGLEFAECIIPTAYGSIKVTMEAGRKTKIEAPSEVTVKNIAERFIF